MLFFSETSALDNAIKTESGKNYIRINLCSHGNDLYDTYVAQHKVDRLSDWMKSQSFQIGYNCEQIITGLLPGVTYRIRISRRNIAGTLMEVSSEINVQTQPLGE